jgi:hypothetical protein
MVDRPMIFALPAFTGQPYTLWSLASIHISCDYDKKDMEKPKPVSVQGFMPANLSIQTRAQSFRACLGTLMSATRLPANYHCALWISKDRQLYITACFTTWCGGAVCCCRRHLRTSAVDIVALFRAIGVPEDNLGIFLKVVPFLPGYEKAVRH